MSLTAILLDMDGVLVDVSGSYRRVIAETFAHFAGRPLFEGAIQAKKDEGGFNNDWVLTDALLRDVGLDVPFGEVVSEFERRYRGQEYDGLIREEAPAITTETLRQLSAMAPLALVTGRVEADAHWTLRHFGWEALIPVVVGMETQDGREKPHPFGLLHALDLLGASPEYAAMAGDTVDDMRAAVAAGVVPVGVVPPGHDARDHARVLVGAGARAATSRADDLPLLLRTLLSSSENTQSALPSRRA
ncbi:MAG: HAD family hydrolase [Bacteroidota bacterium]